MTAAVPSVEFGEDKHGWADVILRHGDQTFRMAISDVSDGLAEFITAVEQVATGRLSGAECRWENEPGFYSVMVRARSEYPYLELSIGYDDDRGRVPELLSQPEPELRGILDVRVLVQDMITAYRGLLEKYGADEYRARWSYDFPQAQLDALSAWLEWDATRWDVPNGPRAAAARPRSA